MGPHTHLYAILARRVPVGVIFRRGPSKQVLLIRWNLKDDTFETGQWLKGRIYERRCDLSPEGDLLIYFAANWKRPYLSWTAVSRPPYLTALALWPKGDARGGGGQFRSRGVIALDHDPGAKLQEGFSLPKWIRTEPFRETYGWAADARRLQRDGWVRVSDDKGVKNKHGASWIEYKFPVVLRKPHPKLPRKYLLEMSIPGSTEREGWDISEYSVIGPGGAQNIGRSEWADWSQWGGDLLYSKGGRLFRVPCGKRDLAPLQSAVQIADFSDLKFEPCETPEEMRLWPKRRATDP